MAAEKKNTGYVLCIENKDCDDLEKRKIYKVLTDDDAKKEARLSGPLAF